MDSGTEVTPFYDPMLAKVIVRGADRGEAIEKLRTALGEAEIFGIETNLSYLQQICESEDFAVGGLTTSFLKSFRYARRAIDVVEPGTQTTIQDYPGSLGYWHVGVPPSGPMDTLAFRLANRLVGNRSSRVFAHPCRHFWSHLAGQCDFGSDLPMLHSDCSANRRAAFT